MSIAVVITTIHEPTNGIQAIAKRQRQEGGSLFILGDRKTPVAWSCDGATFFSYSDQLSLPFAISRAVPPDSYTRKMLGYLLAFDSGVSWIRETDDDNCPYESFFNEAPEKIVVREILTNDKWVNVYSFFTERHIWPRGFPLRLVEELRVARQLGAEVTPGNLLVFQGLADGDPDVDAVYRMTSADQSAITFSNCAPIAIPRGSWTPFNSQATTWPRELLPLMYLPATCSFRMTDIWRSFIVQRLMPKLNASLVITGPTVYQDRNEHDLMRDFRDEIEGYLGYERFVETLERTPTTGGFEALLCDLRRLYVALCDEGFFASEELLILDAWISDMVSRGFGAV